MNSAIKVGAVVTVGSKAGIVEGGFAESCTWGNGIANYLWVRVGEVLHLVAAESAKAVR